MNTPEDDRILSLNERLDTLQAEVDNIIDSYIITSNNDSLDIVNRSIEDKIDDRR